MGEQAQRMTDLRTAMATLGVAAFLVPREDEFMGEYVPACGERLHYISGFTGSAGCAVILADEAVLMTDGRYKEQAPLELDPSLFQILIARGGAAMATWVADRLQAGDRVGYDPRLFTPASLAEMEPVFSKRGIVLSALDHNPLDRIWTNRPAMPDAPVRSYPAAIAGRSADEKRSLIADKISDAGAAAVILTESDSIAWLLNIRGNDVPHTPFALSYAILHDSGVVDWFIDDRKVPADVRAALGNRVHLHTPDALEAAIRGIAARPVMFDPKRSAVWFRTILDRAGAKVIEAEDPCLLPKACKTPQEIDAIRDAHVRDGVALTKFLCWLDREGTKKSLTELDIADMLLAFRARDPGFLDTSFNTIAGWNANGAIVHYRATPQRHAAITPPGILLLDSGAQYLEGTTDVTRTVAIGADIVPDIRTAFTRVLMGHIDLAALRFPQGLAGRHLDVLARRSLWVAGMDYDHGTGHGVGCYLSVHEEGGGFSFAAERPLQENMVISNEPGYYRAGAFGIRIESLVRVRAAGEIEGKPALDFETLTLVPIDRRLIDVDLLSRNRDHVEWLDSYHARVAVTLMPHMDADEQKWLADMTRPIAPSP